jgi:hypothetical protein
MKSNSTLSSNCGGNCPGGCSSCPCGTSTSYQDIASWCSRYGWNQVSAYKAPRVCEFPSSLFDHIQANCQCIMSHESGGNGNAVNENSNGSFDVGLWQINDYNWNSCSGYKSLHIVIVSKVVHRVPILYRGGAPCDGNTNLNCGTKTALLPACLPCLSVSCFRLMCSSQRSTCTDGEATPGSSGPPAARAAPATPGKRANFSHCPLVKGTMGHRQHQSIYLHRVLHN